MHFSENSTRVKSEKVTPKTDKATPNTEKMTHKIGK